MGRNLSLLAHLPRLEADGVTHRRDCECVRCDAGFRPSEHERAAAHRRWEQQRAREAAARALARRQERARARALATGMELTADLRSADAHVQALRQARARVDADRRLALFQSLRRAGLSMAAALDEVERRERAGALDPQDRRDVRVGPAGFEPAANGLKVASDA
jgi:hypothetical protein